MKTKQKPNEQPKERKTKKSVGNVYVDAKLFRSRVVLKKIDVPSYLSSGFHTKVSINCFTT